MNKLTSQIKEDTDRFIAQQNTLFNGLTNLITNLLRETHATMIEEVAGFTNLIRVKCSEYIDRRDKELHDSWTEINDVENTKKKLNMLTSETDSDFKCPICHELIISSTATNCGHIFCEFCIITWKEERSVCPICRSEMHSMHRIGCIDNIVDMVVSNFMADEIKNNRDELKRKRAEHKEKRLDYHFVSTNYVPSAYSDHISPISNDSVPNHSNIHSPRVVRLRHIGTVSVQPMIAIPEEVPFSQSLRIPRGRAVYINPNIYASNNTSTFSSSISTLPHTHVNQNSSSDRGRFEAHNLQDNIRPNQGRMAQIIDPIIALNETT